VGELLEPWFAIASTDWAPTTIRQTRSLLDRCLRPYLKGSTKAQEGVDHEEFEQNVRSMYDQMVRISIKPQWMRFFDIGAGRLPQFLAELAQVK
jgi:hypothetical protein